VVIVTGNLRDLQQYDGKCVVFVAQDRSVSVANTDWCQDNLGTINTWFDGHLAEPEADEADDELLEDD
jgi:hypothetical protein